MEHLEVMEYSGISILNPEYQIVVWNNFMQKITKKLIIISLLFLGHNVQKTNARRPIKGSKDADFHLQ